LAARVRNVNRGDRIEPLDLIEWLEEQGYEPEAQVTQKGELALRGGILDIYPPTSPWPVRLEFFGDEVESLREFDPLTQISRGEIARVTLPPAGELGLLKKELRQVAPALNALTAGSQAGAAEIVSTDKRETATLLDYLSGKSLFVLCEPEQLSERAEQYENDVGRADSLLISWAD